MSRISRTRLVPPLLRVIVALSLLFVVGCEKKPDAAEIREVGYCVGLTVRTTALAYRFDPSVPRSKYAERLDQLNLAVRAIDFTGAQDAWWQGYMEGDRYVESQLDYDIHGPVVAPEKMDKMAEAAIARCSRFEKQQTAGN